MGENILYYVSPGFERNFEERFNRDLSRNLQLRGVHSPTAHRLIPITIMFQHLAIAANMSLHPLQISDFSLCLGLKSSYVNPVVYPWSKIRIGNPNYLRIISKQLNSTTPILIKSDSLPYNHVYCTEKMYVARSDWDYSIFTGCFDYYTNCCIVIAIAMVNLLLGEASVLLSVPTLLRLLEYPYFGFSNGFEKRKSSLLLSLGLMCYTVLSVYYTGVLTSFVTRPMRLNALDNLSDLYKNGFSLAHRSQVTKQQLDENAKIFNVEYLRKLLMKEPTVFADNITGLDQILANGRKTAFVGIWPVVFEVAFKSKKILKQSEKSSTRDCHVGKDLISSMTTFYGFIGNNNERLGNLFTRFIDGGIERLWRNENIGLSIASRMQDRVKFKSPYKDPVENHSEPESLSMKNLRILTIFHYFGVLLLISGFVFLCEGCIKFRRVENIESYHIKCCIGNHSIYCFDCKIIPNPS